MTRGSVKNCETKGAARFMQKILFSFAACSATSMRAGTHEGMKKAEM